MSALARWFLAKNWAVYGSDIAESSLTKELRKEGVQVKIGHRSANLPLNLSMVVHNSAINPQNPEFKEALRRGLKPLSYAQTIGCLTKAYKTVAVAGSHGKSTTTSLIGLILRKAKLDPTIVVGTKLSELNGKNFRSGKSKLFVLEADEYKAAFLEYHPDIAVITNIDKEHLDFYKDLNAVKKSFLNFIDRVKEGGALILNSDDRNLYSLRSPIERIAKKKNISLFWYSIKNNSLAKKIRLANGVPGEHNVSNALAAYIVAKNVFQVPEKVVLKSLSRYRGAWRRMEFRGICHLPHIACHVYDDYAHHPTEIRATLLAFKEKYPRRHLICVYQPHQAKRLEMLFKDFQTAFHDADMVIFLPVYEVAGRDTRQATRLTSEQLARALQKKYPRKLVSYLKNPKEIRRRIADLVHATRQLHAPLNSERGATVVMMGAGTIADYTPLLLRKK